MVQSGVLQRIGKGKFTLGSGKYYYPEISDSTKTIFEKVKRKFPFIELCVWHTSVLNEFMKHQPGRYFVLVETEKEATIPVFYYLREIIDLVFIEPTIEILERYVVNEKDIFIVIPLISEAPVQSIENIQTITIEKMLVDIFSDNIIFSAQHGVEIRTIFENAFDKYTINQSKMLRYADRRGKKEELFQFVKTVSNFRE